MNTQSIFAPKHLERWTMPNSYFGATWEEYYCFMGRNRDSSILENSNFESALKKIGGETETVLVVREGHWAVGWVEWIAIHESDVAALKIADQVMDDYDSYPVLDEMHYSDMEFKEYSRYAESEKESLAEFLTEVFSIPSGIESDVLDLAFYLNLESQMQGGEYSCFNHNIYHFRNTGEFDTRDLESLLQNSDVLYHLENNKAVEYLKAVLDIA